MTTAVATAGSWIRRGTWSIWLGLAVGIVGFGLGAAANPAALGSMWQLNDWYWLGIVAVLASVAAAVQMFSRHTIVVALALGSALIIASFGVGAFVAVSLLLITCLALGSGILGWADEPAPGMQPQPIYLAMAVGLSAFALLFGFTSHLRVNFASSYFLLAAASIGVGWRYLTATWRQAVAALIRPDSGDTPFLLRAGLWFAFAIQLSYAALPERFHDALAMHLVIPRALELFGQWHFDAHEYAWADTPMGADWLFAWAYLWAGEYAAKLLNAMLLLLTCGVLVECGAVSARLARLACTLFVLMPMTVVITASLFVENTLTLFVVAGVVFAIRINERQGQAAIVGLVFCSAGAIAVKLHGVIAAGTIGIALLAAGGWQEFFRARRRTWLLCALALLGAAWPYAYAWQATGNPVYPYFNAIFKSPLFYQQNFENALYLGGLLPTDYFRLAFFSGKYIEGADGAIGFALTLLLPAGLFCVVAAGNARIRIVALTAFIFAALILINIRYLRYLAAAYPLFALVMVYPLAMGRGTLLRASCLGAAVVGVAYGVLRIPAAGWILNGFDPRTVFSDHSKARLADLQAPLRALGRAQSSVGSNDSRVVVFGQGVGADIRGRPLYVQWYFHQLQELVLTDDTTLEQAANTLAALNADYVIFDRKSWNPVWQPWEDAVRLYGRLVASNAGGELYAFYSAAVPGNNVFQDSLGPWEGWDTFPRHATTHGGGDEFDLKPGTSISRPTDVELIPQAAQYILQVQYQCARPSRIRLQINWLTRDGVVVHTDAKQTTCGDRLTWDMIEARRPNDAQLVYFYFANDGQNDIRLSGERASWLLRP